MLAAVGLAAFALMLGIEVVTDDEIHVWDLLGDALQMALVVATAVACALLAFRMQAQHEEKLTPIRTSRPPGPKERSGGRKPAPPPIG